MKKLISSVQGLLNCVGQGIWNQRERLMMLLVLFFVCVVVSFAAVDVSAGQNAMTEVTSGIAAYIPFVRKLIYSIAAIVAIVGAISVYVKMNNEEQDVKKSIMMIVGACIFLIAAATALPYFFGYQT